MTIDKFLNRLVALRHWLYPAAGIAALFGGYCLFVGRILPGIVQTQAEKYIQRSGHHLVMDRPVIDPLRLTVTIGNLKLSTPKGEMLLSFKELFVDFSARSLLDRAYEFDAIRLIEPNAVLTVLPDNRLNWSALLDALQSKDKKPSETPRLIVRDFALTHGHFFLTDRRAGERTADILPLDIHLTDLTTLPNRRGHLTLTARTNFDARIRWESEMALKPIQLDGRLRIEGASLPKLAALFPLPAYLSRPQGAVWAGARYRAGLIDHRFNLVLTDVSAGLDGFSIAPKNDASATLAIGRIALSGGAFDLQKKRLSVQAITLSGGNVSAIRDARGVINLMHFVPPVKASPKTAPPKTLAKEWTYRIGRIALTGFGIDIADRAAKAAFVLRDVNAEVRDISGERTVPLPVSLSFRQPAGGRFTAQGSVIPATKAADIAVSADALSLTPLQPYLARQTLLKIADGTVSSRGKVEFDGKNAAYTGSLSVDGLRLIEQDNRQTFLAWTSLSTQTLDVSSKRLIVRELFLKGLDTKLLIARDKTVNFAKIIRKQAKPAAPTPAATKPFPVRLARLRIWDSQLDFADQSLALPFGTHIHALSGTVVNIASQQGGAPARLQIEGQIDDYGMARAAGRINLFRPTDLLDVKVAFKNVEMTRLTPYSATFAGRRIDSGKLSLDLEYRIKNRQLTGNNHIVMDRLTLGERIESPTARNLPLDLAIAILEDSEGRIDLGLPVSGSLDDPKFSYRQIVWKAIVNVLTKVATSPFRALGALFGSDDKFDGLVFEAGRAGLTPPEREKLIAFAAGLNKHPKLAASIAGPWSDADRTALQDLQLRKAIAKKLGLLADGDPGLITPDQPKVKSILESLYAARFGRGALAAQKEGFAKANPGKLQAGAKDRFFAIMTGLIGTKHDLSEAEVAALKNTDFYARLYLSLRDGEPVSDTVLQQLAQTRADGVLMELEKAKAPMERLSRQGIAKVETTETGIPLKVNLSARKTAP